MIIKINRDHFKRQIVSNVIDELCSNQEKNIGDLRRLFKEVSEIKDISRFDHLEDSKKLKDNAIDAVRKLKRQISKHDEEVKSNKSKGTVTKVSKRDFKTCINEIQEKYLRLVSSNKPQERGYELGQIMHELFKLFDLDPRASFKNKGEQIDGAFSLQGTDYLFEAKWQKFQSNASDLDSFSSKIGRKLENTLGLFLSINGFSNDAVNIYSNVKSPILLMDGSDLQAVLENRISLDELIVRKRRVASETSKVFVRYFEMLN